MHSWAIDTSSQMVGLDGDAMVELGTSLEVVDGSTLEEMVCGPMTSVIALSTFMSFTSCSVEYAIILVSHSVPRKVFWVS